MPAARFGVGPDAPVALCAGLWVRLRQVALVVGALPQSQTGRHRWDNYCFAFRLGGVSTDVWERTTDAYLSDILKFVC